MKITFHDGPSGSWYAMASDLPQPWSGLLVVGDSLDDVMRKLPGALNELREAFDQMKTSEPS